MVKMFLKVSVNLKHLKIIIGIDNITPVKQNKQ